MKKAMIGIIAILAMILFITNVAADIEVTSTYDSDNPTFGDKDQRASTPDADDEDEENELVTGINIPVRNTGATSVTVASISISPASGFDEDDLNITLDSNATIAANSTGNVVMSARIPEELDAVDDDMEPAAFRVATITLRDLNGATVGSFIAYMQRENLLEIDDLDVIMDDGIDEESESLDDGDDLTNVKPGMDIEMTLSAENLYNGNDNNDITIENVEFRVINDDDLDLDEDEDIGDIDADSKEEGTLSFSIDDDVDEDDYDILIEIEGEDEHGARHGHSWEVTFEVEREAHEVKFRTTSLDMDTVKCSRSNAIEIKIQNLGSSDKDEITVLAKNTAIGLDFTQDDIELEGDEESETWTKRIPFTVPSTLKAGTYNIDVQVYYSGDEDDGILADDKNVALVVQNCVEETTPKEEEEEEEDDTVEVIDTPSNNGATPTIPTQPSNLTDIDGTVEEKSFFQSTGYVVLLAMLVIVAIIGGVVLVLKFIF